jgi:hypothetical protein
LAFGDHHQGLDMHPVLKGEKTEVQTAAQDVGLEPRLVLERDDPAFFQRSTERPVFFDDPHTVVGNIPHPQQPGHEKYGGNHAAAQKKD